MVQRVPIRVASKTSAAASKDRYDGHSSLFETLDKGFPYDDGEVSIDNIVDGWNSAKP